MSKLKLSGKCLLIQLVPGEMRVARTTLGGPAPQLSDTLTLELPAGAVVDGELRQPELLQSMLKSLRDNPNYHHIHQVIFSLTTSQVIAETVTTPMVQEKKMDQMLNANIDLYFPVSAQEYRLVWELLGPAQQSGDAEVQLWAVPRALIQPYYTLANSCDMTVLALDFWGKSLMAAAGAGLSERGGAKSRAGKTPTVEPALPEDGKTGRGTTTLQLCAERDLALMTFVRDGTVTMQRTLLASDNIEQSMSELGMVMDYYSTMHIGEPVSDVVLSGGMARNGDFVDAIQRSLELPASLLPAAEGPEWSVCRGAASMTLDFGDPSLNKVKTASQQLGSAWHYVFVLLGGLLLAGAIVLLLISKANWSNVLGSMRSKEQMAQMQAAQLMGEAKKTQEEAERYQGYAENYMAYLYDYQRYSQDWDNLFASLRTYNDNLQLALTELESILPASTSVNQIYISDMGMYLQFACQDKEEAAYLYTQVRNMQYATLLQTSDLTVGPPQRTMQEWLSSLSGLKSVSQTITLEPAPTEGGAPDPAMLLKLQEAMQHFANGTLTLEEMKTIYQSLDKDQWNALVDAYAEQISKREGFTELDELQKEATLEDKEAAIRSMIDKDPIADYRFLNLLLEDNHRTFENKILLNYKVLKELTTVPDLVPLFVDLENADPAKMKETLNALSDVFCKDETNILATEALFQTDEAMTRLYAYHLGAELGKLELRTISIEEGLEIIKSALGIDVGQSGSGGTGSGGGTGTGGESGSGTETGTGTGTGTGGESGTGGTGTGGESGGTGTGTGEDPATSGEMTSTHLWLMQWIMDNSQYLYPEEIQMLTDLVEQRQEISPELIQKLIDTVNARKAALAAAQQKASTGGGGGGGGGGGTVQPAEPADERIFFTVFLGYKQDLIEAELQRKGLSQDEKIPELEVAG